jgi:iron complex outermembrane receptor protein
MKIFSSTHPSRNALAALHLRNSATLLAAALLAASTAAAPATAAAQTAGQPPAPDATPPRPAAADTDAIVRLAPIVVTSPKTEATPLEVILDSRAAARPGPAQDGADLISYVPGVVISRKGGAGGEILLRGAGGSRLDILVDHESILGGCPNRMDPPGAYIFPGDFDSVTVIKGPAAVRHGPGNSAGVVLFKNNVPRFDAPGVRLDASAGLGAAGRNDQNLALAAGAPAFYVKAEATRTAAGDYSDDNGDKVHSNYDRRGARLAAGWTPAADTVLEAHASLAAGEAAYAHSAMDAATLDRRGAGLRFEKKKIGATLDALEAGLFYNNADHVMDNYTLREPPATGMMAGGMASNVAQTLRGGRALATFLPAEETALTIGADFRFARHTSRSGTPADSYKNHPRVTDATIDTAGLFADASRTLGKQNRLHAGARLDTWRAKDHRTAIAGMMGDTPNPTAGEKRAELLPALFARYERDLASAAPGLTLYLNAGHTTRAPDYWELFTCQGPAGNSAFPAKPEKTTQLDLGGEWKRGALSLRASLFANTVRDYLLVSREPALMGMGTRDVTRNIDASTLGGELEAGCTLDTPGGGQWQFDGSLSHVRAENRTDGRPLAQIPPLEGRLAAGYVTGRLSLGFTTRLVAAQHRYAEGQGGIAGLDLGPTAGFAVFSLNAGWRITDWAELSAGVDNLLDKLYAGHVNRAGNGYPGYIAHLRVNEPGRTLWAKFRVKF